MKYKLVAKKDGFRSWYQLLERIGDEYYSTDSTENFNYRSMVEGWKLHTAMEVAKRYITNLNIELDGVYLDENGDKIK